MPKIVDHDKYRNELALKSFDIIAKRGIERVSVRYLAKKLGVSTGVIYRYFSSKDQLFEHVSQTMVQKNIEEVLSRINERTPLEERLNVLLNFVAENKSFFKNLLTLAIDYSRYAEKNNESLNLPKSLSSNYRNAINYYLKLDKEYGNFLFVFLCGIIYHETVFLGATSYKEQTEIFKKLFVPYLKSTQNFIVNYHKSALNRRKNLKSDKNLILNYLPSII